MSFQHSLGSYPLNWRQDMQDEQTTPGTALGTWVVIVVMAILFSVALAAVLAVPMMVLWNRAATDLFSLKRIGYIQAFELLLLARLLFAPSMYNRRK